MTMENFFNNTNLLHITLKWKWHMLILAFVAALVSVVVSSPFIMKPRFKSLACLYPSNVLPYSKESQTEQMLQWINSSDVRDSVIKKFSLSKHYKVPTSDKYYAFTMEKIYNQNVKVSKTQYESIEVSVTDIDPVLARDMVNAILFYTDIKIRTTHKVNYQKVFEAVKIRMNAKLAEMDSVRTLYREIATTYGIYDVGGQSQEITRGELRTVDGGGGNINTKDVLKLKQGMMERSADLLYLGNRISHTATEYSEIVRQYESAKFELDKKVTFLNVVTPPKIADKKSSPKRLFVMIYFVAGTLFFSILAIAFLERRKTLGSAETNV